MDPRVEEHAEILVEYSVDVGEGDLVVVGAPPIAEDLEVALYEQIGAAGGTPVGFRMPGRAFRSYLQAVDPEVVETADHAVAMLEAADAFIQVMGGTNLAEMSDVDPEKMQAYGRIQEPLLEVVESGVENVLTQHPAPGNAQKAEMSTAGYADFVYDAVLQDWEAQRAFQEPMVDILDEGEEVRIVSGDETDLTMSVAGNPGGNDHGELNVPAGEAYTAPVPDSVEGTVLFDVPLIRMGREVQGASLEFEDGEVVDHDADQNAEVLTSLLETDEGARRIGELGIGMNRDIYRFTHNTLFDEKMGDTVHLALGRSLSETVGERNEANESAIHEDMIVDMSENSRIEVDGEIVQRDGTFVFEESEA
jgi:aminopeptidase